MPKKVKWLDMPEIQDYPNAARYLDLLVDVGTAAATVEALKVVPVTHQKAKDILRAAALRLLDASNAHVSSDLDKIVKGTKLSPILLVRGDLARGVPLHIADGYHRVCASYYTDENTDIPVQLADLAH
ncbi:MAG TPA: hypothetical protein DIT15_13815 [Arthrobacter bacterium]|jgi:hypothetical protein|nr:hypothetical protein [Arthrobacter sp.]HAP89562.1 hypothetical protein [Arthrobacter sp.]HBH57069.1 hypothetical protein [Arthrobacter sp.]HCB57301.1 hypothetical protein [Arthrobacter sp.]HCC39318.1 hypothetical protein [Arthrobacter sp.]